MKARNGYTIIELLTVLVILGALATIAMPYYWDTRHNAVAAGIVSDYNNVRVSALGYRASTAQLPPTAPWGTTPPELENALGFSFDRTNYDYRWQVWSGTSLGGDFTNAGQVAGLSVRSADPRLIKALHRTYQGRVIAATLSEITLLIQ